MSRAARFFGVVSLGLFLGAQAVEGPRDESSVRFRAVDVFVDSGETPLAAYQIEIDAEGEETKIVGVEGGEGAHYTKAPYYDPKALLGGRIVLGAFTTAASPPKGRVRVARLHLREVGAAVRIYKARLVTAAAPGGAPLAAVVELKPIGESK